MFQGCLARLFYIDLKRLQLRIAKQFVHKFVNIQ